MKPLYVLLPCTFFFKHGKVKKAIACIILQISLVGWIPAVVWAIAFANDEDVKKQRVEKFLKEIQGEGFTA